MPSVDSFNTTSTNVELTCPRDITGIERIMLAATGNLQRILSAFFSRPINIKTIYAHTDPRIAPASPSNPIKQSRQVHLVCSDRTVCIATSTVTVTSPLTEKLLLDDKYPIGQLFRCLQQIPDFTLVNVECKEIDGKRYLNRLYKLEVEGIVCEILEEFKDRDMFTRGAAWLDEQPINGAEEKGVAKAEAEDHNIH
ncbi:hypothetical protein AX16_007561 [Volvariella volvacea WC 439]|nr:hypothetical protein AX16_007561 [Volvariella volvacea WC 439]